MSEVENLILANQTVIMAALAEMVSDELCDTLQNCIKLTNSVIEGDTALEYILSQE